MSSPYDLELMESLFADSYGREGTPEEIHEFAVDYYAGKADAYRDWLRDKESGL